MRHLLIAALCFCFAQASHAANLSAISAKPLPSFAAILEHSPVFIPDARLVDTSGKDDPQNCTGRILHFSASLYGQVDASSFRCEDVT